MNRLALALITFSTLALASSTTFAQVNTYNFSTLNGAYSSSTTTLTTSTAGSTIQATFSSPYDDYSQLQNSAGVTGATGEFQFGSGDGLYSNITSGEVISSEGYVGAGSQSSLPVLPALTPESLENPAMDYANGGAGYAPGVLNISFSQAQSTVSFDFATGDFFNADGGDYLTLTTNTGATQSFTASLPSNGDFYDEGSASFTSTTPFTSISVRAYDNVGDEDLNLGDLTSTTATPEPASWALGLGACGVFFYLRRRQTRV